MNFRKYESHPARKFNEIDFILHHWINENKDQTNWIIVYDYTALVYHNHIFVTESSWYNVMANIRSNVNRDDAFSSFMEITRSAGVYIAVKIVPGV